jgi:hypothetical protein
MPTPEKSLRSVGCPQAGHSVSVGSVIFCCTSCVTSQVEQAYSYVGTGPPSGFSRRWLALAIAEC